MQYLFVRLGRGEGARFSNSSVQFSLSSSQFVQPLPWQNLSLPLLQALLFRKTERGRDRHSAGDLLHAGMTGVRGHNRHLKLRAIHALKPPYLKASKAASECDSEVYGCSQAIQTGNQLQPADCLQWKIWPAKSSKVGDKCIKAHENTTQPMRSSVLPAFDLRDFTRLNNDWLIVCCNNRATIN